MKADVTGDMGVRAVPGIRGSEALLSACASHINVGLDLGGH